MVTQTVQRELSGSTYKSVTESGVVKSGDGVLRKIVIGATSSGTLKVYDGLEGGVNAVGTLTSTGALIAASHGQTQLTSDATNVTATKTVTIGATVYRFMTTMAQAYDVKIGGTAAASLDNLKAAINATGTAGTEYYKGTLAHPTFIATTNTDTVQTIVSRTIGVTAPTGVINALATTATDAHLSWADTTYGGGTGESNPAVATNASLITIGTTVYTVTLELSETSGATAEANQVLWVTTEAVFLDNLKQAINGSGIAGTDYSTGTLPHTLVKATTNADDSQIVEYKDSGTVGNAIATTETMANYAWGAATLASGTGSTGTVILETTTPEKDLTLHFGNCEFETGLYITVGGTSIALGVYYR